MSKTKSLPSNAKMVFKGKIFEVWQWEQQMFDGSTTIFERLKRTGTVQTIAIVEGAILLQTQEQPDSANPFLSLPGGRIDAGEDSSEAAKRELLEETGYVSEDWTLWKQDDPIGKMEWTIYTYIARNCKKQQEPHLDSGEKITTRSIDFEEFLLLSDDPTFRDLEITTEMFRARLDPDKKTEFKKLLFGESA